MRITPNHTDGIDALAGWLERQKGSIESELRKIENNCRSLTIWPYFSTSFDTDCFPLIMLQQSATRYEWLGLDTGSGPIMRVDFTTVIWGLCHGYIDHVNNDLSVAMAGITADILNTRHENFEHDGFTYSFVETCPVSETTYGVMPVRSTLASGFNQTVRLSIEVNAPQIRESQ